MILVTFATNIVFALSAFVLQFAVGQGLIFETQEKMSVSVVLNDISETGLYEKNNQGIYRSIGYKQPSQKVYEPVVCINEKAGEHRNMVLEAAQNVYQGEIRLLDENYFVDGEPNAKLLECDVINQSTSLISAYEGYHSELVWFLKAFEGTLVASAGNKHNQEAYERQEWALIKEMVKLLGPEQTDKIIVVGEAYLDNGTIEYSQKVSYGRGVDIATPTAGIQLKENGEFKSVTGTSFAAPTVAGTIALILQQEGKINPSEVNERILNTNENVIHHKNRQTFSYPVLNITMALN